MESDQPTEDGFVLVGGYSPKEASKLMERLEQGGIAFRAQRQKMGYDLTSAILVSVDPKRAADADQIHRDLFGDGLPNYDSSFFRGHRNV